ncbi:hypothetical protein [Serinibacter arcticus]|uniref:Uncharacterized protein n=1 Tax=Serinibacter arcticus TaxID=1655435 RepID=A0A4Z1E892_9MICO|nr:hypothetical protein [Serinibacter arcticus]TGO05797.1 hypothetical protein SERN_1801 [Serinibacter arcticus]
MTRLLRPIVTATALMLVGVAGPAAASTNAASPASVDETSVTSAVIAQPGSAVNSALVVSLAAGIVSGATGAAYLVRRSRCRTGTTVVRNDLEVVSV